MAIRSVVIDEDAKTLTIVLDLEKPRASKSGKTKKVATSGGGVPTRVQVEGKVVSVSADAYITKE